MSDIIFYVLFQTIAVDSNGCTYDFPIWAANEADARRIHATYLGGEDLIYLKVTC